MDPLYEERPLSTWVQELVPASPPETRSRAREAIRAVGTNAIPLLVKYLSRRDNSLTEVLTRKWEKLTKKPTSPEPIFLRSQAVAGFDALGSFGRSAFPELKKLMIDKELAYDAARALGAIRDKEAVPLLVDYLDRSEPEMRAAGTAGLGSMGAMARPTVPKLLRLIKEDKNDFVRANAADALGAIGPPDIVIPVLLERLEKDESVTVRVSVVCALGCFPERASELENILQEAERDKSERIRAGARFALRRLREPASAWKNDAQK